MTATRTATSHRDDTAGRHAVLLARLEPAAADATQARDAATALRVEHETLNATAGASIAELKRRHSRSPCRGDSRSARERLGASLELIPCVETAQRRRCRTRSWGQGRHLARRERCWIRATAIPPTVTDSTSTMPEISIGLVAIRDQPAVTR